MNTMAERDDDFENADAQPSILGGGRPLIPRAEQPGAPIEGVETVEETIWQNTTDRDVVLDLYVGVPPLVNLRAAIRSGKRLTWEQRTGKRRYIIRARSERAIPSEFDTAIQQHQCLEPECSQRPLACKDKTHRHAVVGGLAPKQLVMKGCQHRPVISAALDDRHAAEQAAKEKTVEALLAKSENEVKLQQAQEELERLRAEVARKELQSANADAALREESARVEQEGVAAVSSRIDALEGERRALPRRGERKHQQ